MAQRRGSATVANQVLDRLWSTAPSLPGCDQLATDLLTTGRTLWRRLEQEGTTFRALRDQVGLDFAQQLLGAPGTTVQEVARLLGYGDTAAFTHAFRRWTGMSPRGFRRLAIPVPVSGGSAHASDQRL